MLQVKHADSVMTLQIALCNGPRGRGLCISPDSATAAATQPTQQADTSKQQAMPPMPDPSISVTFADALVISTNSEEVQERVLQRWQVRLSITRSCQNAEQREVKCVYVRHAHTLAGSWHLMHPTQL